jgi:hypothetical protein
MADNNENQLNIDMAKLTEQVNKLITALGTVTKDNTDSLVQMKKQIQLCTTELLNMESVAGGSNTALTGLRNQVGEAAKKFDEIMVGENKNTKILTELSDTADDTGEKIGELFKNAKMGLGLTNDLNKNISAVVNQTKSTTQLAVEIIKNKNSVDNKNIPSSAPELNKSKKPTDANILTPNKDALTGLYTQLNEATKKLNKSISNDNITGKSLENITNGVNDTADEIGELIKTTRMGVDFAKKTNDNTSTLVDQNKNEAQLAAEAAREAKKSGSGSATEIKRDTSRSESREDRSDGEGKGLLGVLTEIVSSFGTSLVFVAGMLAGFAVGAVKVYKNFGMTILDGLKAFTVRVSSMGASISGYAKQFATGMFGAEGGLFTPLINLIKSGMKSIDEFAGFSKFYEIVVKGLTNKLVTFSKGVGNFFEFAGKGIAKPFISFGKTLGEIFGPIGNKFIQFFKGLDNFVQFATKPLAGLGTKISNMFSGIGRLFGGGAAAIEGAEVGVGFFARTLSKIGEFFAGGKILGTFQKAFVFGEKLAAKIPFLALIPTIIDTVVSAFKKFDTEGMKGVFKSIIVGLLKGLAAFFTFGLSDLAIDFEKLYTAISKPLDGFFDQVMGIVKIFGDMFNWIIDTLVQLWTGLLKPIIMSLWEDALKPIMEALGALADVAFKLVAIIFKLLTPVFAIIKFIFKVLFEVVKLIWDYVVWPILSILVPIFKVVFSIIGFLFNRMKLGFEYMSIGLEAVIEIIDPLLANITAFFDDATDAFDYLGQMVDEFMKPIVDMFGSLGQMLSDVWSNIVGRFKPVLDFLDIDIGSASSNSAGMSSSPSSAMSASAVASSPKEIKSTAGSAGGGSPVITQVTHAPTTNNVVNGGGGGGGSTVILSPTPVRHSDSTRHMIGH